MNVIFLISLALAGIIIGAADVSADYIRDYGRVYYTQIDSDMMVGPELRVVYTERPRYYSRYRTTGYGLYEPLYQYDLGYPRYAYHRSSGKVFYVADGYRPYDGRMMLYRSQRLVPIPL